VTPTPPQTGPVLPSCSLFFLAIQGVSLCHCDVSVYICIITQIGSSPPLFFSFLP
jgi:hypothetical protein